jgi:hypothetical protein
MIWVQQPSPATSCRCQPPSTATGRPTPATSGNFSGGLSKKKKIHVFYFFLLSFAFVFQPQCLDTLSLRGDVSVYVGLVPHWESRLLSSSYIRRLLYSYQTNHNTIQCSPLCVYASALSSLSYSSALYTIYLTLRNVNLWHDGDMFRILLSIRPSCWRSRKNDQIAGLAMSIS